MGIRCHIEGHDVVRIHGVSFRCEACKRPFYGESEATNAGMIPTWTAVLFGLCSSIACATIACVWALFTFGPLWDWVRG